MAERDETPDAPVKAAPVQSATETGATEATAISPETASLLGLIDKLNSLLERSELVELEVEAGETGIVLRKAAALAPLAVTVAAAPFGTADAAGAAAPAEPAAPVSTAKAVRAPLTGIFYASSSPSAPSYITVGQHVAIGQVIGLIEAMKLFNEIKSDASGKVVRIVAESGKLVKAKQPLIEVEP